MKFSISDDYINKLLENLWEEGSINQAVDIFFSINDNLSKKRLKDFFLRGYRFSETEDGSWIFIKTKRQLTPLNKVIEKKKNELKEYVKYLKNSKVQTKFIFYNFGLSSIGKVPIKDYLITKDEMQENQKIMLEKVIKISNELMTIATNFLDNRTEMEEEIKEILEYDEHKEMKEKREKETEEYLKKYIEEQRKDKKIEEFKPITVSPKEFSDGWITEDGKLYETGFGKHEFFVTEMYREGKIETDNISIIEERWVRVCIGTKFHITKNITQKQIDTIFDIIKEKRLDEIVINEKYVPISKVFSYIEMIRGEI